MKRGNVKVLSSSRQNMAENAVGACAVADKSYTRQKIAKSTRWRCDVCKVATFPTLEEACRHEDQCQGADENKELVCGVCKVQRFRAAEEKIVHEAQCRRSQEWALKSVGHANKRVSKRSESKKQLHGFFSSSKVTAPTPKSIDTPATNHNGQGPNTGKGVPERVHTNRKAEVASLFQPLTIEIKDEKKPSTQKSRKTNKTPSKLAAIFGPNKTADSLLAEHRAVEFQAKRRAAAEKDRKRKTKREKQKHQDELVVQKSETHRGFIALLPFPKESHVTGPHVVDGLVRDCMVDARTRLRTEEKHVGLEMNLLQEPCSMLSCLDNSLRISTDPLKEILSSIFIRPPEHASTVSQDNRLWVDKYDIASIPEDVCGAVNKEIGSMVVDFIEEWKAERQKAHELRAERQEALKRVRKKRKKRKATFDDDDVWDDGDEGALQNVCLISGPVCSGKTSLVRAAARLTGCKVIEINTGESRGGATLKKMVEEATQSDSTSDMFKNKTNIDEQSLFDSDDEEQGGSRTCVPVILFDEVDILYEDHGDGSFWSALENVASNAKCPIFLTANETPSELLSTGIDFRHFLSSKPTSLECVPKMYKIVKQERLQLRQEIKDLKAALRLVAELCDCDLRRIANELQVYAGVGCLRSVGPLVLSRSHFSGIANRCDAPHISSISPTKVDAFQPTLLRIQGLNFGAMVGKDSRVVIGGQMCSAFEVVNDTTIIAVCPPYCLPSAVNKFGFYDRKLRKCLSSWYASLTVEVSNMGLTKSSVASWTTSCSGERSVCLTQSHPVVLRKFPPLPSDMLRQSDPEELTDPDEPTKCTQATHSSCHAKASLSHEELCRRSLEILQEGVQEWRSENKHGSSEILQCNKIFDDKLQSTLEKLVAATGEESDISMFEGRQSVPLLTGAVLGHGTSLVDDCLSEIASIVPARNTKAPNLERILEMGWNDNAHYFGTTESYVVRPTSARDRRLWSQAGGGGTKPPTTRGFSLTTVIHADDEEPEDSEEFKSTEKDVEDILIRRDYPSCLDVFGRMIRGLSERPVEYEDIPSWKQATTHKRSILQYCEDRDMLNTVLSEQARTSGSSLDGHSVSQGAALDYLPLLGHMARSENSTEAAFKAQVDASGLGAASTRRRTRRHTEEGRRHYFSDLGCPLVFKKKDAEAAGSKLAGRLLV